MWPFKSNKTDKHNKQDEIISGIFNSLIELNNRLSDVEESLNRLKFISEINEGDCYNLYQRDRYCYTDNYTDYLDTEIKIVSINNNLVKCNIMHFSKYVECEIKCNAKYTREKLYEIITSSPKWEKK